MALRFDQTTRSLALLIHVPDRVRCNQGSSAEVRLQAFVKQKQ